MSNGIDESFLKGAAEEIFEIIPKTVSEEILKEILKNCCPQDSQNVFKRNKQSNFHGNV